MLAFQTVCHTYMSLNLRKVRRKSYKRWKSSHFHCKQNSLSTWCMQICAVVTLFFIKVFLGFDCSRRQGYGFGLVNGGLFLIQKRVERIRVKWTPLCHTSTDSLSPPTNFTIVGQLISRRGFLSDNLATS